MSLRFLTSLFAGICMLVIFVSTPVARAYVQGADLLTGQSLDHNAKPKPPTPSPIWDRTRLQGPERPWRGQNPEHRPYDEDATAPIPEPGTLTLASLGLLALGAAMRKRRTTRQQAAARVQ